MMTESTVESFRVFWTGTDDHCALQRLVSLVDVLDPKIIGKPMALHAGGDRIVSLSVQPTEANTELGFPVTILPSVVTMPSQSSANERLLMGSAAAVILTDSGTEVNDMKAAEKLEEIMDSLVAHGHRAGVVPIFVDLLPKATRAEGFWMHKGSRWGDGIHIVKSEVGTPGNVFRSCCAVLLKDRKERLASNPRPRVSDEASPLYNQVVIGGDSVFHMIWSRIKSWFSRG